MLQNVCASIEAAIVDVLVAKTVRAARRLGLSWVTASGGVTCNSALRRKLEVDCRAAGLNLRLADKELCTDNAGMIGILAERKLEKNPAGASVEEDILPSWRLAEMDSAAGR
jgi:N6-L-threonylcarbamoyladenine synthase